MPSQLAFTDARGGMNAADPANKIEVNQLARMVNCGIRELSPGTRWGVRVISVEGEGADAIASGNIQGAKYFNPQAGQGGLIYTDAQNSDLVVQSGTDGPEQVLPPSISVTNARTCYDFSAGEYNDTLTLKATWPGAIPTGVVVTAVTVDDPTATADPSNPYYGHPTEVTQTGTSSHSNSTSYIFHVFPVKSGLEIQFTFNYPGLDTPITTNFFLPVGCGDTVIWVPTGS